MSQEKPVPATPGELAHARDAAWRARRNFRRVRTLAVLRICTMLPMILSSAFLAVLAWRGPGELRQYLTASLVTLFLGVLATSIGFWMVTRRYRGAREALADAESNVRTVERGIAECN